VRVELEQVNSYESVVSWLEQAQRAVDEAKIPEDLRAVAFGHAVQLLSAVIATQSPLLGGLTLPRQ
jgi:hypothetical protein